MPTLGNTTKPTSSIEAWSGGTYEIFAQALTLPAGGPWLITDVGVWAAGFGSNVTARVCVWNGNGTLLSSSANFTLTGQAFANGNVSSWQRAISTIQVNGGVTVYVGLQVANNGGYQFGRYASGSHWDAKNIGGALPSSFGAGGSHSPAGSAWLVYETANQAPNAPTSLSPSGNAIVNSGTAPTVSGTRSDPDAGDYITAYQIQVANDALTTTHYDQTFTVGGTPTTFSRQVSLPASHAFYRWRARTRDKGNLWGPWSGYQRFKANSVPSTPPAPGISSSATLVPTLSGVYTDPGDTLSAIQIQVEQPHGTSRWSTGDIAKSGASGAGWSQAYGGTALVWGTAARARYRTKDSHGAYSAWGSWGSWTPVQPQGPESMDPAGTNPRLASLTPNLTVGHSANFVNDEMEVRTAAGGGTQLWLKAWNGSDYSSRVEQIRTYAGTALAWGGVYYWRARVKLVGGTITSWSDWMPFRLNAVPNAPTSMTPTGGVVLPTLTPALQASFSDPDTDQGDHPTHVEQEVRNNATDALVESFTSAMAGQDPYSRTTPGGLLAWETTYKWRRRYRDEHSLQGPWSAYRVFKVSQPPAASLVAPPEAAAVDSSTPTLSWSFSSPGGKAQHSFRLRLFDMGPTADPFASPVQVYDSGTIISSAQEHGIPFGVLVNERSYQWTVEVKDTDGLAYTLE